MEFGWNFWSISTVICLMTVFSCKKEDEVSPYVRIISPSEGAVYNVFDTVYTSFEISDETQLVSATAEVVNSNFVPVTPKVSIQNFNGAAQIVIDDKLLDTGDYYVLITASDGVNQQLEYRKIKIVAVPRIRRAIYVATSNGSGQDAVWKVDSLFQQVISWNNPGQDILKLRVNSLFDRLTLVGRFSKGLRTYDLNDGALTWSDDVYPAQVQRFEDLLTYESAVYTTLYDREIRSYSSSGSMTMNLPTENHKPELIYRHPDCLLIEMNLVGDNKHFLNVYHPQTRALLWETNFGIDITAVCELDADKVMVFGNDGDQARVFHYDIGGNAWWEPRQLPEGKVLDAVSIEGQSFAITHQNGVYTYTYNPNYLNQIKVGTYQDIGYDNDNATIIVASNNMLEEITQIGQTVSSVSLADSIVSFDIHYTR